ncbi:Positive regulator of CheA protein activity (CheW) [Acidisarcina polymorpha]|uniref:Positive regulator of CheA protein activity (CheW) n=1 Tax=Acidisarcina polymorpha TaxID=2211140 RepID=A0A2Z5G2H5_9BACT|nr:chemotaxis protein CheW [Acidisarcina polymorpha]AXC12887.1 Positive regulator of CheA protein activity (CheW) [Acidisarcina polymorpha]
MTISSAAAGQLGETRQYSTFRVADMFMGIELTRVQELLRFQEMTSVPLAPRAIEGLINLRGQIVTALDVRRILGLPAFESEDALPMNIVIQSEGGPVSLLVDEICDVLDVPLEAAKPLPENMPAAQRELLDGVYQLTTGLLLILNTQRVLESAAH